MYERENMHTFNASLLPGSRASTRSGSPIGADLFVFSVIVDAVRKAESYALHYTVSYVSQTTRWVGFA